jgi:hypothetical protein
MQGASVELRSREAGGRPSSALRLLRRPFALTRIHRPDVIGGTVAALGALAAATFSLQLWHLNLGVPMAYGSDALLTEMLIKSVITGGWVWTIHAIGAPFGSQFYDFPVATDNLNWLTMRIIGFGSSNPAVVDNLFFLFTFVADALAAYVVLRWMRVSIPVAVAVAVIYSDSPYHLLRGETHLLLASYWAVPIATYLILSILKGSNLLASRRGPPRALTRWFTGRNVWTVVLCLVIGSLGVYYAVFAMCLIPAAGLAAGVARRSWRPIGEAVLIVGVIGGMCLFNDLPSIIYTHEHGRNTLVAQRLPQESELYALKLAEMVLPVPEHRIPALRHLRYKYDSTTPVPSEDGQQSLGIVGTIGLFWLFAVALGVVAGVGRDAEWLTRHRHLAFAAVVAFVLGTMGGVSALIGYLVTSQIRGWDRISIFIMFFSLAAVALGLDALRGRLRRRWWMFPLLGTLLVVAIYDQSTLGAIPPYAANLASYRSDGAFVARIQRMMPKGAMIYQLPYMTFPENGPVNLMLDYDLGRGYIFSSDLRWSYGAVKGRPQDWVTADQGLSLPTMLDGIAAAGFTGIWIDRYGYTDGGAAIEHSIQALVGTRPIHSSNGRMLFFDIRPFVARLHSEYSALAIAGLGNAILHPPDVNWGTGFYYNEAGSRWATPNALATIDNTSKYPIRVLFAADVFSAAPGHWSFSVTTPTGSVYKYKIDKQEKPVDLYFNVPPGTHPIIFDSNAPIAHPDNDPRMLAVRYNSLVLTDASLAPFLGASAPRH